ncbi:hypothetical protein Ancab_032369 [Ancistrocladus abbreviatus]
MEVEDPDTLPTLPNIAAEADDDDPPTLSPYALEALKEFLSEQQTPPELGLLPPPLMPLALPPSFISLSFFPEFQKMNPHATAQLLEYDKRFERYGSDFTFYDYNQPDKLPKEMKHAYQIVVADPPYLSVVCLEKVAQTIAFLSHPRKFYLLLLTGEVQRDKAAELLGLHPCGFRPQHSSKLGNEFRLFTNYNPGSRLGGWELKD